MTKTCGECQLNGVDCRCEANEKACEEFEQKIITNGEKIRQMSDEELAEMLIYTIKVAGGLRFMYSSRLIDKCYHKRACAVKATLAKLKEVAKLKEICNE